METSVIHHTYLERLYMANIDPSYNISRALDNL